MLASILSKQLAAAILAFLISATSAIADIASKSTSGNVANAFSSGPTVSSDGKFVAFYSEATNLVDGDTNGAWDVFRRDMSGTTTRVSVSSSGEEANADSDKPSISANGQLVVFYSVADNLVDDDTNEASDIFLHNTVTGMTTRVSVDSTGAEANGDSDSPAISGNGQYLVFHSSASNLVAGDTNSVEDVFLHDLQTHTTTRISVDSAGAEANDGSGYPHITSDGRWVLYESFASNLVPGDTNQSLDVFRYDRSVSVTARISINTAKAQGNNDSYAGWINDTGKIIAFQSDATNLGGTGKAGWTDVFVRDMTAGTTKKISVSVPHELEGSAWAPAISADGRWVSFFGLSGLDDLDDGTNTIRAFLYDRTANKLTQFPFAMGSDYDEIYATSALTKDGAYIVLDTDADIEPVQGHQVYRLSTSVPTPAPTPAPNILKPTKITASSFQDPNKPANVNDGNLDTRWSALGDGQWIQFDLGAVKSVSSLKIAFYRSDIRTTSFDIQTSADAKAWKTVFSGKSTVGLGLAPYTLATVASTRYVRILGHGNSDSLWNSINEVQVIGK